MICDMGIPEKIKELRRNSGLSQPELAKKANVSQQLISQIENGKNLTTKHLPAIARALGVSVSEIDPAYAPEPSSLGPAIALSGATPDFGGYVQAGTWLPVDEYFQQDGYEVPAFVMRQPGYAKVRQYAYLVRGDSMNEAGIEDGMWIVAADANDYVEHFGETESGDLAVVERTRAQGAEREMTVKEIRYYRDRTELVPRSTNPEHRPIIVPHNSAPEDGVEVRIVGVVLTAFRDLRRRR
ncbi:MAG: hypothetical protein RLZZ09_804 [Pseudomonadota bacterium]|jgi:transcriptional regulator with XRE-family HTH domain